MHQLNRSTANKPKALPLRILQFGGGNFLRAFVDWMVQILNEETDFNGGVVIVKPTERGDYKTLKSQEGLFTVVLDGIKNGKLIAEKTLIDCVQEIVNPYSDWENYLALAKNPDIRFIVSNTTEAGIRFNSEDKINENPPQEFPGKLTVWLNHRFQHFNGDVSKGCILLPCELIEENGAVLQKTVLQYADHWNLSDDFKSWIRTANHFCSTLVDRIVSGYPTDRVDKIQTELEYFDELLVAGEYYHSWVIQGDSIVHKELPFSQTDLNVEFVNDLSPYREMKVRILNGAHTSMVPVGYLAGIRFVKEAMDDKVISKYIESLLSEEVAVTLDFPEEVKQKYITDVLDRFRNPLLKHQLISISLNSTSKFVSRLLPTLKDFHAAEGRLPERIVFGLSALILFYKGEFHGEKIEVKDDQKVLDFFIANYEELNSEELSVDNFVERILSNKNIWDEDLTDIEGITDSAVDNIQGIDNKGVKETLEILNM